MSRNKLQVNIARLMALCLAAALLLLFIPTASAASGECGSGVSWELTGGVLTISGSGAMADYSETKPAPWQAEKETVRAVIVEAGVTTIGSCAFLNMDGLTSVILDASVKKIGDWAFSGCYELALLNLGGVEEIGQSAFERCQSLTGVRLPDTLLVLRYRAFYGCDKLVSITVPASVIAMETSVFAHCASLQNATVLAGISDLPSWTFYNCKNLTKVTMAPSITEVGFEAFYECVVEEPAYGHVGDSSHSTTTTQQENGNTIITNSTYRENENTMVSTQVVSTKTDSGKTVDVKIDAVLENQNGWSDVEREVDNGLKGADNVNVTVWLKGDAAVSGADLGRFANKNVKVTVHTTQGAEWYFDGNQLAADKLAESYDLSYTLRELTDPDEKQAEALSGHKGYTLTFHAKLDFKVEVEIPLPKEYCRQSAVFFTPEKTAYERRQAVMIDQAGIARLYLGQVGADVDYLIGINVPKKTEQGNQNAVSDVIIPNSMKNEFPQLQQTNEVNYIITGAKSSLGINIGQLTIILAAVMVTCAVVVAVVMRINFKRKLKAGYVPDMSYEDEEEE